MNWATLLKSRKVLLAALGVIVTAVLQGCGWDPTGAITVAVLTLVGLVIAALAAQNVAGIAKNGAVLILCAALLTGCQAPAALQESQAWVVSATQSHLANDQKIEECWEAVFASMRQADIDYATQKAIDVVKAQAKTPADIEEGIKAVVAEREKAGRDTQLVMAKMRGLVATNQSEAAKAMRVSGAIAEWMGAGMQMSAIPNIINEAFSLVESMGFTLALPGVQTQPVTPAPAPVPVAVPVK